MKFAVKLVLLMFVFFMVTPTVVSLIEKDADTSFCYSLTEEELSHKEVKAHFKNPTYSFIDLSGNTSSLVLYENLSKHDNVSATIFIPPPELI